MKKRKLKKLARKAARQASEIIQYDIQDLVYSLRPDSMESVVTVGMLRNLLKETDLSDDTPVFGPPADLREIDEPSVRIDQVQMSHEDQPVKCVVINSVAWDGNDTEYESPTDQ